MCVGMYVSMFVCMRAGGMSPSPLENGMLDVGGDLFGSPGGTVHCTRRRRASALGGRTLRPIRTKGEDDVSSVDPMGTLLPVLRATVDDDALLSSSPPLKTRAHSVRLSLPEIDNKMLSISPVQPPAVSSLKAATVTALPVSPLKVRLCDGWID